MQQTGSAWHMHWSNDGVRMDIRESGAIELTDDVTDVKSLSDGGYLIVRHTLDGVEHVVDIGASNGTITRTYSVGGKARPWDDGAKRWLAAELPSLVRRSGLGAAGRTRQLLSATGVDGVLTEIRLLEGDYVRRVYFTELFTQARLEAAAMSRALALAGGVIRSDYELTEALRASAPVAACHEVSAKAYVEAADRVASDYEHRRSLLALLHAEGAVGAVHEMAMQSAGSMRSDYEKAETLRAALASRHIERGDALFDAIDTMRSDYEKRRVLTEVAKANPTRRVLEATFEAVGAMRSDYERAEVLLAFVNAPHGDPALRRALVTAAQDIRSSHDQHRVLAALLDTERR